jgi:hypothetical protein
MLFLKKKDIMTTVLIDEKTKIGRNIIEMLRVLANAENVKAIKFLDETDYLMASKSNKAALLEGVRHVDEGIQGESVNIDKLWK